MADNVTLPAQGTGTSTPVIAADDVGGVMYQRAKLDGGGDGVTTPILAGGGVEASALRVTIASDSTGVLSVDDNGGSLTVDGTVAVTDGGGSLTVDGTTRTEYTEGDTDASITGTAVLMEGGANTLYPLKGDSTDGLLVNLGSNNDITITSGTVTVGAALPAGTNNIGDVDVLTLPSIPAGSNKIGAVDLDSDATIAAAVPSVAQFVAGTDGVNARALKTDTSGELQVDVITLPNVTIGTALPVGTNAIGKLASNSGVDIGDVDVTSTATDATPASAVPSKATYIAGTDGTNARGIKTDASGELQVDVLTMPSVTVSSAAGDVAHDAGDSGNPVKIGFKALSALPAAVATTDRANGISDLWGRQLVAHVDPAMQTWKSANYTTTQTGTAVWTPASGKKIAVTYLALSSYGTTGARCIVWASTTGSADTTYSAGTDQLIWAGSFAPSSTAKPGVVVTFPSPIFITTADYPLRFTSDAGISIDITVYGYEW